ncbi:hypothetical protein [Streptacidiphilus sp. EB129]|uniref:hypothetical protein n=1 Tax=Streptacidiphilus sp. EB129 TaxID=3156262 RepID=UPI0035167DCF
MTVLKSPRTAPGGSPAPPARAASRLPSPRRLDTRTGLRAAAIAIVALLAAAGLATTLGTAAQDSALGHAATRAEPLGVVTEEIYRDLSDADAAAAQVLLAGPESGTAVQQRYDSDIQRVSSGLAAVSADATSPSALDATGEIIADLPVYTRLVGTALADSRQNLPVGAAYLREASALLRTRLLSAARQAHDAETADLDGDGAAAAADPLGELALLVACVAALGLVQVFAFRRTNRMVNPGLAVATVLVLALAVWTGLATPAERGALARAAAHRQTADALVATELAAIQAHGDELLGLAARGEDLGGYERDFTSTSASVSRLLAADHGSGIADARAAQQDWLADHRNLVELETEPQADNSANTRALLLLTSPAAAGSGAVFARMDTDLRNAVETEESSYRTALGEAQSDLSGLASAAAVVAAVALAGAAVGINRRLREYR